MSDTVLSLICPTRGRQASLMRLCHNIVEMSGTRHNIQFIFICDDDDIDTLNTLMEMTATFPSFRPNVFSREHDDNLTDGYYNWILSTGVVTGDYVGVIGNDVVYRTENWGDVLVDELSMLTWKDGIVYAYPTDMSDNKPDLGFDWGWFPIVSARTVEVLGYLMPPEFPSWGADTVIARIFHEACPDRMVRLSPEIDHISHHAYGNIDKDTVAASMESRYNSPEDRGARRVYMTFGGMKSDVDKLRKAIGLKRTRRNGVAR